MFVQMPEPHRSPDIWDRLNRWLNPRHCFHFTVTRIEGGLFRERRGECCFCGLKIEQRMKDDPALVPGHGIHYSEPDKRWVPEPPQGRCPGGNYP